MNKSTLKRRVSKLEKRAAIQDSLSKALSGNIPEGSTIVKGRWYHPNPEICKTLPMDTTIKMWRPTDNVKVFDKTNYHLLPCYGCNALGTNCQGPTDLKLDIKSIMGGE